jgi:murein DD-endopeptidase MepM/ murein hydrolase activator NlpD
MKGGLRMNSFRKIWIMLAGTLLLLATAKAAPAGSFPWVEHSVALIDTLESIADHYGIESSSLRWANELPDDEIPFTLEIILVPRDENLLVETRAEVRARKNGNTTEGLYAQNDEEDYSAFTTREAEAGQTWTPPPPVISFQWPTEGRLFSKYGPRRGRFHSGIDISAPRGTPIKAAAAGTVVRAAWRGGYGRTILVDHGNGSMTRYAHCDKMLCRAGDSVAAGQKIGTVGRSGRSTGYHLHFEIIINGKHQNPEKHLPPKAE